MKKVVCLAVLTVSIFLVSCQNEDLITSEATSLNKEVSYGDTPEELSKGRRHAEFEILVENMTPATGSGASQPLSPPVIATHSKRTHIFKVGSYASSELGQLAEDAVNAPMIKMLKESPLVYDVVEGSSGPIFPGEGETFRIKTVLPFKNLSLVSMLVNTNDAFAGANSVKLPKRGSRVYYLNAYDAGTEVNTELQANIPGPCCGNPFVRVESNEKIRVHSGIKGVGDIDKMLYGWKGYVAKITITRIK